MPEIGLENHKKACAAARSTNTKTGAKAKVVKALTITKGCFWEFWPPSEVEISSEHDIFNGEGHLSPVSKLIGCPLLVHCHREDDVFDSDGKPTEQGILLSPATSLMVDPIIGDSPPE